MNRSEYTANQFLAQTVKRQNYLVQREQTSISVAAVFVLVFGAVGFMLSVAYFAS
jgi:hypothetical protein